MINETLGPCDPNKVNKRWPAIMLAANRIDKVRGRIIFLIVSMHTMNAISKGGVPWGTKWASICKTLFIIPKTMKESHRGIANESVISMCLVLVKI